MFVTYLLSSGKLKLMLEIAQPNMLQKKLKSLKILQETLIILNHNRKIFLDISPKLFPNNKKIDLQTALKKRLLLDLKV
jgi:hypothetical protein